MTAATRRSAQHATFVIEREFAYPPARVFAAWADPRAKEKWFGGPTGQWTPLERQMEFRTGGRDRGTRGLMDALERSLAQ